MNDANEIHNTQLFQKTELSYTMFFEQSIIPIVIIDPENLQFIDGNEAAVNVYGVQNREQLLLADVVKVSAPTQFDGRPSEIVAKEYIETAITDENVQYEWKYQRPSGELWEAEVHMRKFQCKDKQLLQFTVTDITERNWSQQVMLARLRISEFALNHTLEELLRKTLDEAEDITSSNIGFFHFLQQDQITLELQTWSTNTLKNCNAHGRRMHYDVEKAGIWVDCIKQRRPVIHNDYSRVKHKKGLPPNHAPVIRQLVVPVMRGGLIVAILGVGNRLVEYSNRDVEAVSLLADLAWDVTAQKRAEWDLEKSEEHFKVYVEKSPVGIFIVDENRNFIDVNPAACSMTGYSREELLAMKTGDFNVEGYEHLGKEHFEKMVKYGEAEGELLLSRKNGEQFWSHLVATKLNESEYIGYHTDITERKLAEEELRRLRDEALQAVKKKSEFLAVMSHEIRTPMNAIIGMAELLSETSLNEEQRKYVNMFTQSGENLLRIINSILDLSKLEANKVELEKEEFDLADMFNQIAQLYAVMAQKKKLNFIYKPIDGLNHVVIGDSTRLYQIASNFLSNSIKFTEAGEVELSVQCEEIANKLRVTFTVRDTGVGIPENKIYHLFQAFTQADSSTSRRFGGTGLGLAIAKMIAEKMGGKIVLESEEGIGSSFTCIVDLETGNAATQSIKANKSKKAIESVKTNDRISAGKAGKRKILLVEDSLDNQMLVQAFLKNEPVVIDIANNGYEAVNLFAQYNYDLILMDIEMPGKDGLEATKEIRTLEDSQGLQAIPILSLSAHALPEYKRLALAAGCNEHLAKPIKKFELINRMSFYLP